MNNIENISARSEARFLTETVQVQLIERSILFLVNIEYGWLGATDLDIKDGKSDKEEKIVFGLVVDVDPYGGFLICKLWHFMYLKHSRF